MQVHDSDVLLVGCADISAGCADLEYPALAERELRNSLTYELAYHAPLQQERLVWGYRVTGSHDKKQTVRLYYLREGDWHGWLEDFSALNRGVDAVLPPHVCLDPLLGDVACFLPAGDGDGFLLVPTDSGKRDIQERAEPPDSAVGGGDEPLARIPGFDPGELAQSDPARQREFLPAILLALYGQTPALRRDRKTRIDIPYDLRPVRYRYSKIAAALMATALVGMAGYAGVKEYLAASSHLHQINEQIRQVERAQEGLLAEGETVEGFDALAEELLDVPTNRVSFGAALAELTQLTPDALWVNAASWEEGRLTVQFSTEDQDADILNSVEQSELFAGVNPGTTQIDRHGVKTIQLSMFAALPGEPEGNAGGVSRGVRGPTPDEEE